MLMMAIPVAGMTATAVVVSSSNPTDQELVDLHFAEATAIAQVAAPAGWDVQQGPRTPVGQYYQAATPNGDYTAGGSFVDPREAIDGRVLAVATMFATVQKGDSIRQVEALAGDMFAPELEGRYDILEGTAPTGPSEVAVSSALAESLGISLADEVTLPPAESPATVVGIARFSHAEDAASMVFGSEAVFGIDMADPAQLQQMLFFSVDATITWDDVLALNEQGIAATSPLVILSGGPYPGALPDDYFGNAFGFQGTFLALAALVGGFLLVQVVLLAGAAFMVGARQQQRALAVVASVGAETRLLRAVVTANGIVLGVLGALIGVAVGIGAGAVVMTFTTTGSALQYPGFHLDPLLLGAIALAAVGSGWVAAAIPARVATRIDIVSALRGARKPAVARRGAKRAALTVVIVGGGAVLGGGIGLVILRTLDSYPNVLDALSITSIGLGAVLVQVGVLLALPSLLRGLAQWAQRATTAVRLAMRDTARNSGRTVPVAAAVMSTVFVASFLLTTMGAIQVENEEGWVWSAPPNSINVAVRAFNPSTGEISIRDDLDELVAGVSDIAQSTATVVEGIPTVQYWGQNPVTGEPTLPPEGTTTVVVALDEGQVCPLNMPGVEPPADRTYEEWLAGFRDDPRCSDRADQSSALNSSYEIADVIRVGEISTLEAALGASLSAQAIAALESGDVVALRPEYVREGHATIEWIDGVAVAERGLWEAMDQLVRRETIPAVVQELPTPVPGALLMTPSTAADLGLEPTPGVVIAHPPFTAGQVQDDQLLELSQTLSGDPWAARGFVQTGAPDIVGPSALILVSASAAIALAASAIALGLARIDGRRDDAILGAVGATRRLRRASGFWQALLLAGLGSLMGTALGVLAAGALALPGGPLPFAPPVVPLAVIGFAVPLVISVGAWLFAGKGSPLPTDRSAIA